MKERILRKYGDVGNIIKELIGYIWQHFNIVLIKFKIFIKKIPPHVNER